MKKKPANKVVHQFGLFGYQPPRIKIPISAAKIKRAKELHAQGDYKNSAALMREVREGLEAFEQRLTNQLKEAQQQHGA